MTVLALALAVLFLSPRPQATAPSRALLPLIVAEANGVTVTADELRDAAREARASGDTQRMLDSMTVEGLGRIARQILERKLLARSARSQGLDKKPDTDRAITRAVETLLVQALLEQEITKLDTSDSSLRRYYDTHQAEFRTAPRRKAHHIVVKTRDEAVAALAEVKAGTPFDEVARARNIDSSRASGGDLGWVPVGVMVKPFEDALFAVDRPGQMSGIVQTSFGFHIIKVDEVDPGQLPAFDSIKDRVKQVMVEAAVAGLKAQIVARNPATINKDALTALATGGKR